MNRALLEFPGAHADRPLTEGRRMSVGDFSTDILDRLDELRHDLECIEKAIMVVERLAFARLRERPMEAGKSVLRKKVDTPAGRKNRLVAVPRPVKGALVATNSLTEGNAG